MADSIRYNITLAIAGRFVNVLQALGYNTNIGQRVAIGKVALANSWSTGCSLLPGLDEPDDSYGSGARIFQFRIEAMSPSEDATPQISPPLFQNSYVTSEQLYADIVEAMEAETLEVTFQNGTLEPQVGNTVEGAASSATGYVESYLVNTGSWVGGDAAGVIVLRRISPDADFEDGENVEIGGNPSFDVISSAWTTWRPDYIESINFVSGPVDSWPDAGESIAQVAVTYSIVYSIENGNPYL
jgi:hypothetical protein